MDWCRPRRLKALKTNRMNPKLCVMYTYPYPFSNRVINLRNREIGRPHKLFYSCLHPLSNRVIDLRNREIGRPHKIFYTYPCYSLLLKMKMSYNDLYACKKNKKNKKNKKIK